jgi:hypothetical protein
VIWVYIVLYLFVTRSNCVFPQYMYMKVFHSLFETFNQDHVMLVYLQHCNCESRLQRRVHVANFCGNPTLDVYGYQLQGMCILNIFKKTLPFL